MKIIEINGKEYIEERFPSVAEVMGLAPKGSTLPQLFPIVGYAESPSGKLVPMLGIKMREE
ncbi:hypothetical protein [Massiliimalia massiliensis]|uniref:hypothetical protein n=1 Tax=Massiliimalia massiliensis TaxID=1852384 RepID=UPI000985C01B|nr:hypothetical protein [Massiliimalia massiliensis]